MTKPGLLGPARTCTGARNTKNTTQCCPCVVCVLGYLNTVQFYPMQCVSASLMSIYELQRGSVECGSVQCSAASRECAAGV